MKPILVFVFILFSYLSFSQTPTMLWQKTIGGSNTEGGVSMVQISNGNYVICSGSFSNISGEKTEANYGMGDFWIFEISPGGSIVWQKTFGGDNDDSPQDILQTPDGGFLILGTSSSPVSGNKTATHYGGADLWLLKLKADGTEEWQKSYGGSLTDKGACVTDLNDGTYIISASSWSDISGNKTVGSKGGVDYWMLHIDNVGSILNQFVLGGSNNDFIKSVSVYPNNRLFVSGQSDSDISGDKQENSFGSLDYWVLITNLNGTVLKSTTIGGSSADFNSGAIVMNNKKSVLFGYSDSPVSGNKTIGTNGWEDYWVVKLDSNLNIMWDVNYGGDDEENGTINPGIFFSPTNTIICGGVSWSGISGNKTLASFGDKDIWLTGMDTLGVKEFEFVAGGSGQESYGKLINTANNTIFVLGGSRSGISGNKLEPTRGYSDVWMFELDFNVGIEKVYSNNELKAYPIPATTILRFSIPMKGSKSQITLTDVSGKTVLSKINDAGENEQIDITKYASGIYILSVISDTFQYSRKIIIK